MSRTMREGAKFLKRVEALCPCEVLFLFKYLLINSVRFGGDSYWQLVIFRHSFGLQLVSFTAFKVPAAVSLTPVCLLCVKSQWMCQ